VTYLCLDKEKLQFFEHYGLGAYKVKLLHCTAFYAGGHSDEGYAMSDAVQQSVGKHFSLEVSGVVITPRTVCARVRLTDDQLLLHRPDIADAACVTTGERETQPATAVSNAHNRAHITLGYTQATQPVHAGYDLLHVLHLAACSLHIAGPVIVDDGDVYYYGDGQCSVNFAQPLHFSALFAACY